MKKAVLAGIVGVTMLSFLAGVNTGQTKQGNTLNGNVKRVIDAANGHRPVGLMPSGAFQEAVYQAYHLQPKANKAAPAFPPSPDTNGCPNVYSKPNFPNNYRANQNCDYRRQAEVQIAYNPAQSKNLAIGQNDSRLGYNRQGIDFTLNGDRSGTGSNAVKFGDYQPPSTQSSQSVCVRATCDWTYDAVSDPALAWGSDGRMYYGLLGFDINDPYTGFWVLRSEPGRKGSSLNSPDSVDYGSQVNLFDTPTGLIHDNASATYLSDDKEFIAVDPNDPNHVVATWTIFDLGSNAACPGFCDSPIFFSQSFDGGLTWNGGGIADPGAPTEISGNNPSICRFGDFFDPTQDPNECNMDQGSWPVFSPDGSLNVVFNNSNTNTDAVQGLPAVTQQLFVKCDVGANCSDPSAWSTPVRVSKVYSTEPMNGISGNIGNGCPLFRQCLPPNGYRHSDFPSLGIDNNTGKLAVFYSDFKHGTFTVDGQGNVVCTPCNEDVWAVVSTNGGSSWGTPKLVNSDESAQYYPWGDVGENGTLYVGYYTREKGNCETDGCLDFQLSTSTDDGTNWSEQRITTSSMPNLTPDNNPAQAGFIGDYNSIAVAPFGVLMTWADTRGLEGVVDEDAYYAHVPLVG
jgi:hypothetical protein